MLENMSKIIVIGAGASGLMAAAAAAQNGNEVTVLEKNEKAGKKIYITGKGRCNFTNDCETQDFFSHVVSNPRFLYSAVYGFDHDAVKQYMEDGGCPVKTERGERCFPVSDHASDITKALLKHLEKLPVWVCYKTTVSEVLTEPVAWQTSGEAPVPFVAEDTGKEENKQEYSGSVSAAKEGKRSAKPSEIRYTSQITGVRLSTGEKISADAVIVCTGGLSYPSTGSTGGGYRFAESVGHTIREPEPSLVSFHTMEDWPKELTGLSLRNIRISVRPVNDTRKKTKKPLYEGFGEMLFTERGLSGPLILTASSLCSFHDFPEGFVLHLNLKPAIPTEELVARIGKLCAGAPAKQFRHIVEPLLPARLSERIVALLGIDGDRPGKSITEKEIRAYAALLQDVPLTIPSGGGFAEAVITRGGVNVKEVNPSTMESRLCKGLYFAGEVLDVDAVTGGFNLQIAWSTGHLAGESACSAGRKEKDADINCN